MKIAVIGAGAYGTALGEILARKGFDVDYYDKASEQKILAEVLKGAQFVLLTVPSAAVPYVLPDLPKDIPLIVATKGILSAETFAQFRDCMVISGPGFAEDIKAHKPTVLTMTDPRIKELFGTDYLTFDFTDDENGVLMCGALKNVYAIEAGLRNLKRKTRDWNSYIEAVCEEMKAILAANGAEAKTVDLVCGVGDLKLTCGYPSRNYEFGDKLRVNVDYQPEKTVEGVSALKKIKSGEIVLPDGIPILRDLMRKSDNWA